MEEQLTRQSVNAADRGWAGISTFATTSYPCNGDGSKAARR